MEIKVIGCGNAFSYKNYNQSFLLEEDGRRMLIDCGTRVPIALHDLGIDIKSIDDIYVSHQHSDHCGGLEEMAFLRYDWANHPISHKEGPVPYAPKLIANEKLLKDLWNTSLSGGLKSMEGFDATLDTYFIPKPIKANQTFIWQNWACSLIQQIHVMTGSVVMNTFGLFMKKEGHPSVFFTTDSQYFQPEQVRYFYDSADLVFQDCELTGVDALHKTLKFKSGVHASYAQLAGWESVNAYKLGAKTKGKLYLSHYQDYKNDGKDFFGNYVNWDALAKEDGFAGFISVGQTFEV